MASAQRGEAAFGCGGGGGIARLSRCIRESLGPSGPPCRHGVLREQCSLVEPSGGPYPPASTKQKWHPVGAIRCLVEAGGIEPPSASPLQTVLHT